MADYNPLENHTVQTSLNNLFKLESSEDFREAAADLDPSHKWAIDRVFAIGHESQLTLERLSPGEMNIAALDGIANGVQASINELNAFVSNRNAAHINNARNQAESNTLVQLKRLMPIGFAVHPKTEGALEAYKKKAAVAKRRQEQDIKTVKDELGVLKKNLESEAAGISALRGEVEATRSENESLLTDLRKADIERVEKNREETNLAIVAREKRLEEHIKAQETKLSKKIIGISAKGASSLQELEKKKDEAAKIVQSVGDLLTTGTYADRASTETKKADNFRNITVGLFAFGLLIIVSNYLLYAFGVAFGQTPELAESWQSLAARIATGLAVTLPAFYTARESARHRTNADMAKQRELELTTLGPFIELLPDAQKTAIRDRLTDRYFGGEVDAHEVKPPVDLDGLAKVLAELAKSKTDDVV